MVISFDGDDQPPIPQLYLACRLTNLTADQRMLLDSWCTHIEQAVTEAVDDSSTPWTVSVYTPFAWSAPWNDSRSNEDVHSLNSTSVHGCAAVIILCIEGGGLGVGQEFAWATALRLPVLLLHPAESSPSRQVLGTPGDVTVVGFANATDLSEAVKAFLRQNRSVIEDWQRRRESLDAVLLPLRETLAEHWCDLGEADKHRVETESRVHHRRIEQIVDGDHAVSGASMSEILALVGALGIDANYILSSPAMPDLNYRQRDALALAADEYEWGGAETLALETRARLELARGGTRRLSLVTPADWVEFRHQTQGHG